jgi:elongation factor G
VRRLPLLGDGGGRDLVVGHHEAVRVDRGADRLQPAELLGPIMKIEVVSEAEYLGTIIGDINRRRGSVSDQGPRGGGVYVQGFVPLAEMFGYINFLRSSTSGRGTFTMEFDHYADVPTSLVEKLMEREA